MPLSFLQRLDQPRPLLLDGATGTELTRRGIALEQPLWSASALLTAPEMVEQIHREYVEAGAEVITANTFRTQPRRLGGSATLDDVRKLTKLAVELARSSTRDVAWVAGSLAPLEDCYRPELTPPEDVLDREHAKMAELLASAGVDIVIAETHPTIRESVAAARAVQRVGLAFIVSWVCGLDGRLLSGESVVDAVQAVTEFGPSVVMVNCLPLEAVSSVLSQLTREQCAIPAGVSANVGWEDPERGWIQGAGVDPATYAANAEEWLRSNIRVVGGCCGTTPTHIAHLRRILDCAMID